jgi:DNA mismatch repair protein MutL
VSNIIKILPQFLANRIAAGEVVGRPESVAKELMENSIDAGAGHITLRIKDAGKTLIQVDDDGCGMTEDDAMMCFMRHSTSKIKDADDLENIRTLGFRGEALASISAVAQVELKTRSKEDELGTSIKNHGSEIIEHSKIQTEKGTSVTVKNLFYNTPARRNFLKSNQTEFRHIHDSFVRMAISHPQTGFTFINNDEVVYELEPSSLIGRINDVTGKDNSDKLMEVNLDNGLVKISGYVSKPSFAGKSREDQVLYLNNRYVISKSLSYAVHFAFGDLIEKGNYPDFYIFITIDPVRCDVNVHPSKLEVKFEDERIIFSAIRKAVANALTSNDLVVKADINTFSGGYYEARKSNIGSIHSIPSNEKFDFPKRDFGGTANIHELFEHSTPKGNDSDDSFDIEHVLNQPDIIPEENEDEVILGRDLIWQFRRKYIMYQMENTLMIIDQHAAHERILYEQAVERLNSNAHLSQQLLIPLSLEFDAVDFDILTSVENELKALGFDFTISAKRKLKLTGIPSDVRIGNEQKILQDIIDIYKENDVKLNLEKRENLAKSYACKHAIRTGDVLSKDEMLNLIDRLFSTKLPYVCPHGRPTVTKITLDELDKMFARIL